jgi:predicted DNA-binding transcriptional regulator AlpA
MAHRHCVSSRDQQFPAVTDQLLTVPEILETLSVPRSTLYRWWQLGEGPRRMTLPNGQVRVRQSWLDAWLVDREDAA